MKKYLILTLFLILCGLEVHALEIVYPKTNPAKIEANSTFFIGSTKPNSNLEINNIEVKVSPLGAFAVKVLLNEGTNNFELQSGKDKIKFVIERTKSEIKAPTTTTTLIEYPKLKNFFVKKDNVPLRITPIDSGINRLSHLPKDVQLNINGEKGNFYRVYLNSNFNAWISKQDVEGVKGINEVTVLKNKLFPIFPRKFKQHELINNSDFCLYEIETGKKLPFAIKEENGITLQIFDTEGKSDNNYTLNIPVKKLIGYEGYYEGNKFILKVRKFPVINSACPLKGLKIALDAGHGGKEQGAIGCCGDKEKDINLAITKELQKELEIRGAKIVMTRTEDIDVSLADRVKTANESDAALLISIHSNALPDGQDPAKSRGTSIYYYHNQAKALANSILDSMTLELKTQNDKVRQGSLALVRPTSSVSILIEVAYIINPDDYALLTDKNFQKNCAKAIADGIENYLNKN